MQIKILKANNVCTNECIDDSDCSGQTCQFAYNIDSTQFGVCSCDYGWSGDSCEIGPCTGVICQNEGFCQIDFELEDFHSCVCNSPYYGENCELDSCASVTCQNGGVCLNDGKTSAAWCECQPGYEGNFCQNTPCTDVDCNSGLCQVMEIDGSSQFECTCPLGYPKSTYCDLTPCNMDQVMQQALPVKMVVTA